MTNKDDFRYRATENAIIKAFMKLAKEQGITNISVSDLCRQAGISRNAFYLHYAGIADLSSLIACRLMSKIEAECFASADRVISTSMFDQELPTAIFAAFESNEELLRILLLPDNENAAIQLAESLAEIYRHSAEMFGKPYESREHRLICSFVAWAHIGFIKQWISETKEPLSEGRDIFIDLQKQLMHPHYRLLTQKP